MTANAKLKYARWELQSKRDDRRKSPVLWRKEYWVWPAVYSPWLPTKEQAKAWLPEDK
jgi:hypothetical protein